MKRFGFKGTISLSLQVSWGVSTWKNDATRSYIGIILILDFKRGDFCHIWHSPISLILTKHIILNINLSPQLVLKFLLCSVCLPFLFSIFTLSHHGILQDSINKQEHMHGGQRVPVGYFSFKLCLQNVMLVAWNQPWQEYLHWEIANNTNQIFPLS